MKKIERRAFVCLALALLLAAGLAVFLVKYFLDGGDWASSAFNRHLYDSSGVLSSGTVLDRLEQGTLVQIVAQKGEQNIEQKGARV